MTITKKDFILLVAAVAGLSTLVANKAQAADTSLASRVTAIRQQAPNLSEQAVETSLKAYDYAHSHNITNKSTFAIIDYKLASNKKRLFVIDAKNNKIIDQEYVAHGRGSGGLYATKFSDTPETHESSLGVYLTGSTYKGDHEGMSLRLNGLDKGFNDAVFKRAIVMHSAWYANKQFVEKSGYAGRSWGCPAVGQDVASKVVKELKNGCIIVGYYPSKAWLSHSKFLQAA